MRGDDFADPVRPQPLAVQLLGRPFGGDVFGAEPDHVSWFVDNGRSLVFVIIVPHLEIGPFQVSLYLFMDSFHVLYEIYHRIIGHAAHQYRLRRGIGVWVVSLVDEEG